MGKSMVLKDGSGHAAGYVRERAGEVLCSARSVSNAQLALVFEDGSRQVFALETGAAEQRFSCKAQELDGCYVFRDGELLLVSAENMRNAFARNLLEQRKETGGAAAGTPDARKPAHQAIQAEEPEARTQPDFPQRRWPPPPCWDAAQYLRGRWQEP